MKEHPILFTDPMVRAILSGAKTQTRRALKVQPLDVLPMLEDKAGIEWVGLMQREPKPKGTVFRCKFGKPGDRLWVREAWGYRCTAWSGSSPDVHTHTIEYRADGQRLEFERPNGDFRGIPKQRGCRPDEDYRDYYNGYLTRYWAAWRPSIHIPRWASRILLEVVSIRVERLEDISEADCIAEGIEKTASGLWSLYGQADVDGTYSPRASYRALWEALNGPGSWDANPWVWVIEFKQV